LYIDPVKVFGAKLLQVDKPSRYAGGETGRLAKKESSFQTLIAFPDLYEIGMGNQALRIIYNRMNNIEDISCDRCFAPAPDFEKLLRENNTPLYGLDTGISLLNLDLLMFTLGYELGLNGILTMLDVSGIPLHCDERNENHPIVIAGGPAVSNPSSFSPFIDAFWMGEAEAGFFDLALELAEIKKRGEGTYGEASCKKELLERIASHPNMWVKGKTNASRAISADFIKDACVYPIPSMKTIQNHGTVEIMRGCPNGCRFCHAGFWYRPARCKDEELIIAQVNEMVKKGGWQEISLSSLSSGDYPGIENLIESLNNRFKDMHVSFQLPSLKVSSFALSILEKISLTRKSGITFAVETPHELWQLSINKEVKIDSVAAILEEARKSGWKGAKFYFMIGLPKPLPGDETTALNEEEEIVSFVSGLGRRSRMHFNINVGIFIPKPHTPYQWAPQIDSETAEKKLNYIKSKLKPLGHKVSVSDSLISRIEGLLSRGDERAGFLCEEAWKNGSRLDAWDEYIDREKWLSIFKNNADYIDSIFSCKADTLPWAGIDSCVSVKYLKNELERSDKSIKTPSCLEKCCACGVCKDECLPQKFKKITKAAYDENYVNQSNNIVNEKLESKSDPSIYRVVFSFSKKGTAVFHGHLSLIEIFSMSFKRAGIPVMYTQGFNPLAKMEFASPLATGISADNEIAAVNFEEYFTPSAFTERLNSCLPDGILINKAQCYLIKSGMKKHSLSSLFWGSSYTGREKIDYVNAKNEKLYRQENIQQSVFELNRSEVLARNTIDDSNEWASYFDVYGFLYNI